MTKKFYTKTIWISKKISTAHAVVSLTENIEKATDNKMFVYWRLC